MENPLISFKVPQRDASLDIWKDFIRDADWQVLQDVLRAFRVRWEPEWAEKHDKNVRDLLWERLFRFENPVLSSGFLEEEASRIVFVEDGVAPEEIRAQIAKVETFARPCYVIEKCGKLRAFALTKHLILLGRTVSTMSAGGMVMCLKHYHPYAKLLTFAESVIVNLHYDELCRMMEKVNVPSLRELNFWMLDSLDSLFVGEYNVFVPKGEQCLNRIEAVDACSLVAKL